MSSSSGGEVAHVLITIFGGMLLMALPFVPSVISGRLDGSEQAAIPFLMLGGPAVASTAYRLLRPRATIWHKLESGERIRVSRSTKARWIHVALAL